jgi:hypothetical protein
MTSLRFTGKDIPQKLITDLGDLGPLCIGYDFADKGDLVSFSKPVEIGRLAAALKHGDVRDLGDCVYLLRNDDD